ncbi:ABC transporter permease [Kitasatospora sp. NPDC093550]|uniref:ABC transporter permease n=1 Tax=Kitasatospora sp. NPDC093550 TaxID=3364089 RepID=UPI003801063A
MRRFWLSAQLSYRALFTWLNPAGYVASRFLSPIFAALLFGTVAEHSGGAVERPVVGGALMAVTAAAVFGVTLAVTNERFYGTLSAWLSSPQGLLASMLGKSVTHAVDGLLSASVTFLASATVFGVAISPEDGFSLLLSALAASIGGVGMGIVLAALAVALRDTFTPANIGQAVLTVVSGAFVPVDRLPAFVRGISSVLPLSHAMDAAMAYLAHGRVDWRALGIECLVGLAWGAVGLVLFARMTGQARRHGTWNLV